MIVMKAVEVSNGRSCGGGAVLKGAMKPAGAVVSYQRINSRGNFRVMAVVGDTYAYIQQHFSAATPPSQKTPVQVIQDFNGVFMFF